MTPQTRQSIVSLVAVAVGAALLLILSSLATVSRAAFSDVAVNPGDTLAADTLDPPTAFTASDGVGIQLDWTATADTYASGHRILRSTAPGGPYTQVAEVTPATTEAYLDAAPEGIHYYIVRAFHGSWLSVDAAEVQGRSWRAFDCPSDTDLRLCISFDEEVGGSYADGSTYGNDVAVTNGILIDGISDQAADGSASSRYEIADSASLDLTSAVTMEMWVKFDSLPSSGRVGLVDNDGQYSVMYYPDGIRCSNGITDLPRVTMSTGVWTHVACVWDGSTLVLYLDGVSAASSASTGTMATANSNPISLLDTSPDFLEPLDGALDNFRIWNSARTQAEICADAGLTC